MKVIIIDFKDSFTFNISGMLQGWGVNHKVFSIDEITLEEIRKLRPQCIIWGPGPGHPSEYENALKLIDLFFKEDEIFQLGICLGHQLLLQSLGFDIVPAPIKRHGRKDSFQIPSWKYFENKHHGKDELVQYYSSLAVKAPNTKVGEIDTVEKDGVVISSMGAKHLSFQFHPESVGTSCPEVFFHGWLKSLIQ